MNSEKSYDIVKSDKSVDIIKEPITPEKEDNKVDKVQDSNREPEINIVDLKRRKSSNVFGKDTEMDNIAYPLPKDISHEVPSSPCSLYSVTRAFMKFTMHQFFRDINILGKHNIPKSGPVIFCGNHSNQFMDGCILLAHAQRDVRFMVAAKVSIFIHYSNFLVSSP